MSHIITNSLFNELDCGLFELPSSLIGLLHHSDDRSLIAEHLVLQTKLLLHLKVLLLLNLVKNCHFKERFSDRTFDLHEIGAIKSYLGSFLSIF